MLMFRLGYGLRVCFPVLASSFSTLRGPTCVDFDVNYLMPSTLIEENLAAQHERNKEKADKLAKSMIKTTLKQQSKAQKQNSSKKGAGRGGGRKRKSAEMSDSDQETNPATCQH